MKPLTATQAQFILEYEANGRNATAAYLRTHPKCVSRAAAAVNGLKTLRLANVAAAVKQLRMRQWRHRHEHLKHRNSGEHPQGSARSTPIVAVDHARPRGC